MKEGINGELRMQYMQEQMQTNPMLGQIAQSPDDPRNEQLQEYMQYLNFQYQQHGGPNKRAGKIGVAQAPGVATDNMG